MAHNGELKAEAVTPTEKQIPTSEVATADPSPRDSGSGKNGYVPADPKKAIALSDFFHWHEPGTSKEEKKLIFKLDWFLLSFSCLAYFLKQFYVMRFFIGLFESAAWPGLMYVLGCWYRKSEMARRSGLFVVSGVLGQMFSGYLQAALFTGMEGKGGMPAWRWLFIFDFILCIPVVIYGIVCYPDTPHTTTAFWLTEWERQRARERIEEEGRMPVGKMDWSVIKRIFGSWQVYAFTLAYCFWSLTCGNYVMQYFSLYLKSTGAYTIPEINNIPTSIGAVNFIVMISSGFIADKLGQRGPVCFAVGSLWTFCFAVLSAWTVPHGLRMAAFILTGCYGCFTPLLAGWTNEACGGDQQKRAFILGFMVSVGYAVTIPFQQYQMPSGKAPQFADTKGWPSALAWVIALTLWTGIAIPLMQRRSRRNERARASAEVSEP
ncbi:related to transporter protein [Cephalotrichum gorgonifer]|uniref:Related to transporter protein n=1 Tax=Cephalotrichum gorgonifer TaxID=2041049 RepID=A0AAE8N0Z5_9PEZI|nr:related to transporter protein [Cephalotrichum gorgonifer]